MINIEFRLTAERQQNNKNKIGSRVLKHTLRAQGPTKLNEIKNIFLGQKAGNLDNGYPL